MFRLFVVVVLGRAGFGLHINPSLPIEIDTRLLFGDSCVKNLGANPGGR